MTTTQSINIPAPGECECGDPACVYISNLSAALDWLSDVVEHYRPADADRDGCPQCDAPAVGDRIPMHTPRCPWNDPNF